MLLLQQGEGYCFRQLGTHRVTNVRLVLTRHHASNPTNLPDVLGGPGSGAPPGLDPEKMTLLYGLHTGTYVCPNQFNPPGKVE